MKRIILIAIAVIFAAISVKAQINQPLSNFGTDTLAYLKFNFDTNQAKYVGKKFETLLYDYAFTIKSLSCGVENQDYEDLPWYISSANISYTNDRESERRSANKTPDYTVKVYFRKPYSIDYEDFRLSVGGASGTDRALYLKNLIVDKVVVF